MRLRGRVIKRRRHLTVSECALCVGPVFFRTRYGFRAHMWNVHRYESKAHRKPRETESK